MRLLTDSELKKVYGGVNITSTMIKAITDVFENILDAERNLGSSIRRLFSNNICPLN